MNDDPGHPGQLGQHDDGDVDDLDDNSVHLDGRHQDQLRYKAVIGACSCEVGLENLKTKSRVSLRG